MYQVFLGIGGNLGNKHENLKKALHLIENKLGEIIKKSSVYETPPWGFQAEENFWNMVAQIETSFTAEELLFEIKNIEKEFGRKNRKGNYTSREMDVDILYFNELIVEKEQLKIPHPRLHKRLFVLAPLAEIAPSVKHPLLQKSSSQLLRECEDKSVIKKIELKNINYEKST